MSDSREIERVDYVVKIIEVQKYNDNSNYFFPSLPSSILVNILNLKDDKDVNPLKIIDENGNPWKIIVENVVIELPIEESLKKHYEKDRYYSLDLYESNGKWMFKKYKGDVSYLFGIK